MALNEKDVQNWQLFLSKQNLNKSNTNYKRAQLGNTNELRWYKEATFPLK